MELQHTSRWRRINPEQISEDNVEYCYTYSVLHKDEGYKNACVKVICENLRVENCIRFLNFSKGVKSGGLLATVRGFVLKNIDKVKSRSEFLDLLPETIDTLVVPITTMGKEADEPQLDYSPSVLFLSLYEWMKRNGNLGMIEFVEILEKFPIQCLEVEVLRKCLFDEELMRPLWIHEMFCDALLKKRQKNKQCSTQGKVVLGAEMGAQVSTGVDSNHLEPQVETVATSSVSTNERNVLSPEMSVSKAPEPVLSGIAGSTASLKIPSPAENEDRDVIIIKEIPRENGKVSVLGGKTEAKVVTTDTACMHAEPTAVRKRKASPIPVAAHTGGDVSLLEVSSSDPALSVTGSTVRFGIPSTPERDNLEATVDTLDWLSEVMPKVHPYFPQIGDELVYFRQGHERYMQKVDTTRAYYITCDHKASLPYKLDNNLPAEMAVKLTSITFENYPPHCVAILELERINWESKQPTGGTFSVCYHYIRNEPDFLVLRRVYDHSLNRQWKNGDRFRSMRGSTWRTGTITQANVPYQSSFPDSRYLSFLVAWDDHGICQMEAPLSVWELYLNFDPELSNRSTVSPEQLLAINNEIFPSNFEWQETEIIQISTLLDSILKLPNVAQFLSPLAPEFDSRFIDYPVTLSMIRARLGNSFYRSKQALLTDSEHLARNVVGCFPDDVARRVNVFNQSIRKIVSDCLVGGIIPDSGNGNVPGASKREMNGKASSVKDSLTVAACNSSQPFNESSKKRRVKQRARFSPHVDVSKRVRSGKSLFSRSGHSHVQDGSKQGSIGKKRGKSSVRKLHHCEVCDYQSTTKQRVKDHQYKHTRVKPYSCAEADCGKSYAYSQSLQNHQRDKHGQ